MKNLASLLILTFCLLNSTFSQEKKSYNLHVGEKLEKTNVKLMATNSKKYSLQDLKKKKGLLIIFAANKCIAIKNWQERIIAAGEYANNNDIGVVWINSNETSRNDGESIEDMKAFKEINNISPAYVQDKNFLYADMLGVSVTPTCYLLDANMKIIYQGVVDNNMMDSNNVEKAYLMDALEAFVSGSTIESVETYGRGCRITRI